jgi:hypothetical protein
MTDTIDRTETTPLPDPPPVPDNTPPLVEDQPAAPIEPIRFVETLAVVALAFLADILLYTTLGGTGAGIVLLAALACITCLLGRPRDKGEISLAVFIALCSVMMIWRHWWLLEVMGWTSVFILAAKRKNPGRRIPEALLATTGALLAAPLQVISHTAAILGCFRKRDKENTEHRKFPIKIVLIPLGVCVLFLIIFGNANPVVARLVLDAMTRISEFFDNIFAYISIQRFVIWMLWLTLFSGLVAPLVKHMLSDYLLSMYEGLDKDARPQSDKATYQTALVTLVTVNLLFLAYNALDSVYLYFKASLPDGIGWTEYTHAGCGWLTLGLLVSTIITGFIFKDSLNFCPGSKRLKILSHIWTAQNVLLAVGSMRRLQMYIDYSGLTHLRIVGIYGSLLVAAGLVVMARKVHANRSAIWMLRSYTLAFYTSVAILALTPNDFWCATYNTTRIRAGKPRALRPVVLKTLSAESLPPLIPLMDEGSWYENAEKTSVIQKGIAALIADNIDKLDSRDTDWRKWQGSEVWALRRLDSVRERAATLAPIEHRQAYLQQLKTDYDLTQLNRWRGSRTR